MSLDRPLLQSTLDDELANVARTRVNALPSVVAERFAALRWRLDRVNEYVCDGYATEDSPDLEAGTPIEVKAVRVEHHDGIGRIGVHVDTHRSLLERGGRYVIVLYTEVDVGDRDAILVLEAEIVDPEEVDRYLPNDPLSDYQKVRWDLLIEADREVIR